MNHGNHVARFIGQVGDTAVPKADVPNQRASLLRIAADRRCNLSARRLLLRLYPLTADIQMRTGPQLHAAVFRCRILRRNVDDNLRCRMRYFLFGPEMRSVSMERLRGATRTIRVAVVKIVVESGPEQCLRHLHNPRVRDDILENIRRERRWPLLEVPFESSCAAPLFCLD